MSNLDHALAYAATGIPVFAVHTPTRGGCSCGDSGCGKNTGKHPRTRHGLDDGTTDLEVVRAMWSRWPDANIGARTGDAFDVFDVDHTDPYAATADWPYFCLPGGPVVRTGSGGWHFHFLPTGRRNATRFDSSLCDWRGVGGYCILPPSVHASGQRYEWVTPSDLPLQPAPAELLGHLDKARKPSPPRQVAAPPDARWTAGRWNPSGILRTLATAADGTRNHTLNWCAHKIGQDVAQGRVVEADALAALDELATLAERIGLGSREVMATIESGYTSGRAA